MTDLLETVTEAHGGLPRWAEFHTVSARLVQGGVLWSLKGQPGALDDVFVEAGLHDERFRTIRSELAYFVGTAMWTYLTQPFTFTLPGFETSELGRWEEKGEQWRRLHVRWPSYLATHSEVAFA